MKASKGELVRKRNAVSRREDGGEAIAEIR